MKKIILGIDPGVQTGMALWNGVTFSFVRTVPIHEALFWVFTHQAEIDYIRVEDARKRKWFGKDAKVKQQGAGSIKRDCKIWDDFLGSLHIPYEMVHPIKGGTKLDGASFKKATGYTKQTSNHARDAAMLVWEYKVSVSKR